MHEYFDEPFGTHQHILLITKLTSHIGVAIVAVMKLVDITVTIDINYEINSNPSVIRKKLFKFFNYNQDLFISIFHLN